MTPELKTKLGQLLTDAQDEEGAEKRTNLQDRYNAEPYGDEVDGRSKFVDASVSDVIEAILPDVMDVFTSAESIVEFSPVGAEDEDGAKQETQAVHYMFWEKNAGFEVLYSWFKECMIQQNSYVYRGWVERERVTIEEYEDLTPDEFLSVMQEFEGDEYKFLSKDGFEVTKDDQIVWEDETVGFKIKCVKKSKEYVVEAFPQEDFIISKRHSKLNLEGVPCCGRIHRDKTKDDWLAFGFSEQSLEMMNEEVDDEEKAARFHTRDLDESESQGDEITVYEVYAQIGEDGKAPSLHKIWCNSDASTILEWEGGKEAFEEVSDIPIHALTPYIMPHRHTGRSVAENVDDIAQAKTVLMRLTLDSMYANLYARPYYDETQAGPNLESDLANPAHGAGVRTGGAEIDWQKPNSVASETLPLMGKFDDLQEMRVGATRYNQGLDADSLNKTASGISQIMNASQKKTKLLARTFAETGLRDLFLGIHRDLRAGPMREIVMKLRGEWVPVNPRTWKHRTDMTVNVGMGRSDRDERRQGLMMAGQVQRELMAAGSVMVDEEKLYNTIDATLQTFGMPHVDRFFNDPRTMPPKPQTPPPPDPMLIAAQSQQQKQMADAQRDAAKMQADERDSERKHQEAMAKIRLQEIELQNKIQDQEDSLRLEKNKAVMDDDFKRDKLEVDALTGFHREATKQVQSEPPVSYEEVKGNTP